MVKNKNWNLYCLRGVKLKRCKHLIVKTVQYTLLLILLAIVSLSILFQLPPVKDKVFSFLSELVHEQTGYKITAQSVALRLPLEIRMDGVEISQEGSPTVSLDRLVIAVTPSTLSSKKLTLDHLGIHGLKIHELKGSLEDSPNPKRLKLPSYINIKNFVVDGFEWNQNPIIFEGVVLIDREVDRADIVITAYSSNAPEHSTTLSAAIREEGSEIIADLSVKDQNLGLFGLNSNFTGSAALSSTDGIHLGGIIDSFNHPSAKGKLFVDAHYGVDKSCAVRVRGEELILQNESVSPFNAEVKGTFADDHVIGNMKLESNDGSVEFNFDWNGGALISLTDISGGFLSFYGEGNLLVNIEEKFIQGKLSGNLFDVTFGHSKERGQSMDLTVMTPYFSHNLKLALAVDDLYGRPHGKIDLYYAEGHLTGNINTLAPVILLSEAPFISMDLNAPFSASISGGGAIDPIVQLFVAETTIVKGEGILDIKIGGTLKDPLFDGKGSLRNGRYENYLLGTVLNHVSADVKGDGKRIHLTSFDASDANNGTVSASGLIELKPEILYPYTIKVAISQTNLIQLDTIKGTFSGQLVLSGNHDSAIVAGELTSDSIVYTIPKKSSASTETVQIHYINQSNDERSPTLVVRDSLINLPINFDLNILIPNNLVINNDSLASDWKGKIKITGTYDNPKAHGELKTSKGEYLLNGQQFEIFKGTISFDGEIDKKTTLYVTLSREFYDIRVEILLKGQIKDPDIVLRSTPSLSQQEILSLVLFGRVPSEITPNQDVQLHKSLSNLTKDYKGPGLLDRIQKTIGIDRIDIRRNDSGDGEQTAITVGKYLTRDVYISVDKVLGNDGNNISIEAKLGKNVKAEVERTTDSSGDSTGQVSIQWKHDY